jgi:glycerophosphoryl diester phosphodiesterase
MAMHSRIAQLISAIGPLKGPIAICAHRGNSSEAPENTLAAIESAIAVGADAVEIDAQLSSDAHLVVMHDQTCQRTGRHRGRVRRMTLQQLRALDVGQWFSKRFRGERIPTLEEVIRLCEKRIMLVVEVKSPAEDSGLVCDALVPIIRKYRLAEWACVVSFCPSILTAIHNQAPELNLGILLNKAARWEELIARPEFQGIIPHYSLLTQSRLDEIKRLGKWVCTWTIDRVQLLHKLLQLGQVDIVATNAPRRIIQAVSQRR